jgi:hypothetical protein
MHPTGYHPFLSATTKWGEPQRSTDFWIFLVYRPVRQYIRANLHKKAPKQKCAASGAGIEGCPP